MIRTLFDSTDLTAIPLTVDSPYTLIGSYCNGRYAVSLADAVARFPTSQHVRINVTGDPSLGNCLDVETGDATPADIDPWAAGRRAAGIGNLAVYCNRGNLAAVLGTSHEPVFHWVATLDGTLVIPAYLPMRQPTAVQFAPASVTGIHADLSLVFEDGWHWPA